MNLNTANLKVGLAAANDAFRTNLNSIHVTPRYTEATNGFILARVSLPPQYDPEELPACLPTEPAENLKPFTVPAKPAMAIKPLGKKSKSATFACLNDALYVDVKETNLNGHARFASTDRESTITPVLQKVDAEYPETDRHMPKGQPDFHSTFKIEYLEDMLKIAKATGADRVLLVGYTPHKGEKPRPLYMKAEHEGQTFKGIVMPLKD